MKLLNQDEVPTMTSKARVAALHKALQTVHKENIEGSFVECGTWRGGNIIIAKTFFNSVQDDREVWGFDTFEGMTAPSNKDGSKAKATWQGKARCESPYEEVIFYLNKFGIQEEEVKLIKGDVKETLLIKENIPEKIAILRLDTDFYDSTLIELKTLYSRLVPGGYLIIDDYGHWQGCRAAVHEFFGDEFILENFTKIDYTGIISRK